MREKTRIISGIKIGVALIVMIMSMTIFAEKASSAESYKKTIQFLDEQKDTVTKLTLASTTASTIITMIPDDAGTPIANKLADLSADFIIVLSALYLEKYLLTIIGLISFRCLLPIACLIYIINKLFYRSDKARKIAQKIAIFALMLAVMIPVSVKVSRMVETTYKVSIENTIAAANQITEEFEKDSDKNVVLEFFSKVTDKVSNLVESAKTLPGRMIEAFAVMMVISCVLPILTVICWGWLMGKIWGIDISFKKPLWARKVADLPTNVIKNYRK